MGIKVGRFLPGRYMDNEGERHNMLKLYVFMIVRGDFSPIRGIAPRVE